MEKAILNTLCVAMVCFIVTTSSAATYNTKQITDNIDPDYLPQINAYGWVVWHSDYGENRGIFLYDPVIGIKQITKSPIGTYDQNPKINALGQVVWERFDGSDYEIFLYDPVSGITQLTNNDYNDSNPEINQYGQIVWVGEMGGWQYPNIREIFLYEHHKQPIQITNNAFLDVKPKINDLGQVVWQGWDGSDWEIFLYDTRNPLDGIKQITDNDTYDSDLQINAVGQVVWQGWDGSDYEIFLYDSRTNTTTQITNNTYNDMEPKINDSGMLVWSMWDGSDYEIFLYDPVTSTTTQITNNSYQDAFPQINALGQVVWNGPDGTDDEIFLYDSRTNTTTQITANTYDDWAPQINASGQVVWFGGYEMDTEIFLASPFAEDPPIFLLKWGALGVADGKFQNPFGVAVDSSGNVYVAEYGNHRIQKFDASGGYLTKWGSYGTGNGQFNAPLGVAVDSLGNVYVADFGNHRIQKFNNVGQYITQWGSQGTNDGQFLSPIGVAVDSSGNVYVADYGNHRIQKFDTSGEFQAKWPVTTEYDFHPFGIAVDLTGNIYVIVNSIADRYFLKQIEKYGSNGVLLAKWGLENVAIWSYGIAVDSSGNVYVAKGDRIQKFDGSGVLLTQWGSPGSTDGQFDTPRGVAVDSSGNLYVADEWNNRIQKFVRSGWTSVGNFVSVSPVDPNPVVPGTSVAVTFSEVTAAGITTVASNQTGTPPPAGFSLGDPPVYFDIRTTATFEHLVTVCINYTGISVGDESKLRLYHQAPGGAWEDVTTSLDTAKNIICGVTASLSPFAVLEATYRFTGFFDPVRNGPVVNLANAGKAIPLKWQLQDQQGVFITDLPAVTGIRYQKINCPYSSLLNEIEETVSSGSSGLRYDFSSNQYVYAWKTANGMAGKCYQLNVELFGFDVRSADFQMW